MLHKNIAKPFRVSRLLEKCKLIFLAHVTFDNTTTSIIFQVQYLTRPFPNNQQIHNIIRQISNFSGKTDIIHTI